MVSILNLATCFGFTLFQLVMANPIGNTMWLSPAVKVQIEVRDPARHLFPRWSIFPLPRIGLDLGASGVTWSMFAAAEDRERLVFAVQQPNQPWYFLGKTNDEVHLVRKTNPVVVEEGDWFECVRLSHQNKNMLRHILSQEFIRVTGDEISFTDDPEQAADISINLDGQIYC